MAAAGLVSLEVSPRQAARGPAAAPQNEGLDLLVTGAGGGGAGRNRLGENTAEVFEALLAQVRSGLPHGTGDAR
jgi:hypothetical protein